MRDREIAGELTPTTGTATVAGHVGYLPQHLVLHTMSTVADFLGIGERLHALRAIEFGAADQRDFEVKPAAPGHRPQPSGT